MIHGKMVTTTRTLHLFEHIELLSQLKIKKLKDEITNKRKDLTLGKIND